MKKYLLQIYRAIKDLAHGGRTERETLKAINESFYCMITHNVSTSRDDSAVFTQAYLLAKKRIEGGD